MKINIIIPFVPLKPGGGLKVMFEYANHLSLLGHSVTIYYPLKISFSEDVNSFKMVLKYLFYKAFYTKVPDWFKLSDRIKKKMIYSINNDSIEDADIVFSTWWALMFDIKDLSLRKGKRFNLIQDIETWTGREDDVKKSYVIAKSQNVVIAKYLFNYIKKETGITPNKVSFAIDHYKFAVKTEIQKRNPQSICMLYSTEQRKGTKYGMEALTMLKKRFPEIVINLFGITTKPNDFPSYINYYENYHNIPNIYNDSAIFIGPSNQEGCALPPMEAMYCGCAVVCTDIEGHMDYAIDNQTCLLTKSQNANDLFDKVCFLIEHNDFRIKLAIAGNNYVKSNTWEKSTKELEQFFLTNLN